MASCMLCDSPAGLDSILLTLSNAETVFLDCEGVNLGTEGGTLSIVSLGVVLLDTQGVEHLQIYLIDIPALKSKRNRNIKRVMAIIESDNIQKVVYDGRMDASEFFHSFGVEIGSVVDLQVADVLSRTKRREGIEQQLQRIHSFVPPYEVKRNRALYSQITKLNGLDGALREHGFKVEIKKKLDHSKWLERPIDPEYLQYAAEDIQKIHGLYEYMKGKGYIQIKTLEQKSSLYQQHYKAKPPPQNPYKQHGLLPLAIFNSAVAENAIECDGCERELPPSAFKINSGGRRQQLEDKCLVCQAVDRRAGFVLRWEKNKEEKQSAMKNVPRL